MNILKLSGRLSAISDYVNHGARVIDVGTDHGLIPVYLAQNNIARRICASDINRGPLEAARASAEEHGVAGRIEFARADGLSGIPAGSFDTVILAGLGGELMSRILAEAAWTRENGVRLILQPQSKLGSLCGFLSDGGFEVTDVSLALDGGRIYVVMLAGGAESRSAFCDLDVFRLLLVKRDRLLAEYLDGLIARETNALDGMSRSKTNGGEAKRNYVNELLKIRSDVTWRR